MTAERDAGGSNSGPPAQAAQPGVGPAERHALVDHAPVIMLRLDPAGLIADANPHFELVSGRSLDEVVGRDFVATVVPEPAQADVRDQFASLTDTEPVVAEMLTQGATTPDIEWYRRRVTDADGTTQSIVMIGIDVTERVARERELRRAELRLDLAQRIVRVGTWERDRVRRTSWYSDQIYDLLELPRDQELASSSILMATHPDDRPLLEELYEQSRSDPAHFELTHRLITAKGTVKWCIQRWYTEFGPDGTPLTALGTLQDITERHQIEEDLRDFRSVLDQTLDCVFMIDAESLRFVYVNVGAVELVGFGHDELLRMHPYDIDPQHDEAGFRALVVPLVSGQRDRLTFETVFRHREGREIPVGLALQRVDSEGRAPRFVAVVHDLTERRRAEDLLRQMNVELEARVQERTAELVAREEDLRRAHQIAGLGQYTCERHGENVVYSDEVYRLLGVDPATPIDRAQFDTQVPAADRTRLSLAVAQVVETGEPVRVDHRILRADGTTRWVQHEITVDPATDDRPLLVRGTLQDITARKEVEAALVEARHEAEEANDAKTEFLSRMSHELRTPLNAVLGFAQILDDGTLSPDHTEFLHEIKRAGEHLLDMVNELLDLTRIEAGAITVEPRPIDTEVVLAACIATVRPLAEQRQVSIETEMAGVGEVVADPIRLRQILLNLLSNAIKYNREGGSIRVVTYVDGRLIRITVADTGLGIAESSLDDLFTPFTRLETNPAGTEGAGIGLAISKRLVEAMGGSLGVSSVLGEGSEFWVELPRPDRVDDATAAAQRATVLCIADDPSDIRLLERVIGARDEFEMLQAQRADTALRLAGAHRPNVILLDLGLPGTDGEALLGRLRAVAETATIPVIALGDGHVEGERQRAVAAGFDEYVAKPFSVVSLLEVLRHLTPGTGTELADRRT